MGGFLNGSTGHGKGRRGTEFRGPRCDGIQFIRLESGTVSVLRLVFLRLRLTQRRNKPSARSDACGPRVQRQN